jgi:hypothetical protein
VKCPYCGTVVVEGAESCTQCDSRITWSDGEATFVTPDTYVPVFTAWDATVLPVVESLLESNGIPFTVANEDTQDIVGLGRAGMGFNPIVGPPVVRVPTGYEDAARELIASVGTASVPEDGDPNE